MRQTTFSFLKLLQASKLHPISPATAISSYGYVLCFDQPWNKQPFTGLKVVQPNVLFREYLSCTDGLFTPTSFHDQSLSRVTRSLLNTNWLPR
ncbi:hypothetical protein ABKN59_010485 [Abortiporus biennis]